MKAYSIPYDSDLDIFKYLTPHPAFDRTHSLIFLFCVTVHWTTFPKAPGTKCKPTFKIAAFYKQNIFVKLKEY